MFKETIQQDLGLAIERGGEDTTPTFLVWEPEDLWMQPVKMGEDKGREVWWASDDDKSPLAVHSSAAGTQKLRAGPEAHSPEPRCPAEGAP